MSKRNGDLSYELVRQLWNHFERKEWELARSLLSDEFTAYWPQSRERFNSPDDFIDMNKNYPGSHKIEVLNLHHEHDDCEHSDTIISEVFIKSTTCEGKRFSLHAISIFEIEDDKIKRATEYWADSYEAPEWRKQWVEIVNG